MGDTPNDCLGYDTKQFVGEVPVVLEHWEMRSTSSLTSLPGSLWSGVVAFERVLSMGQRELNWVLMLNRNVLDNESAYLC